MALWYRCHYSLSRERVYRNLEKWFLTTAFIWLDRWTLARLYRNSLTTGSIPMGRPTYFFTAESRLRFSGGQILKHWSFFGTYWVWCRHQRRCLAAPLSIQNQDACVYFGSDLECRWKLFTANYGRRATLSNSNEKGPLKRGPSWPIYLPKKKMQICSASWIESCNLLSVLKRHWNCFFFQMQHREIISRR